MKAIDLIKQFEGCKLTAYQDVRGIWTIGWGQTGRDVCEGKTCTQAEADQWLEQRIAELETRVKAKVHVPLSASQLAALVSFAYNCGFWAFQGSTLLSKLNAHDYAGAADEFLKWDKAGGKPVPGLTRRREEERQVFLS